MYNVLDATVTPVAIPKLGTYCEIVYADKTYFGNEKGWFLPSGTMYFEQVRDTSLNNFLDLCMHRTFAMECRKVLIEAQKQSSTITDTRD